MDDNMFAMLFWTNFHIEKYDQKLPNLTCAKRQTASK